MVSERDGSQLHEGDELHVLGRPHDGHRRRALRPPQADCPQDPPPDRDFPKDDHARVHVDDGLPLYVDLQHGHGRHDAAHC